MCHYNQQCVNTVGTYRCQAKCGPGFKPSITGTSCEGKSLFNCLHNMSYGGITICCCAHSLSLMSPIICSCNNHSRKTSCFTIQYLIQYAGCPCQIDKARCVNCVFQMWMSAKSLLSPHASISVSILWAPTAVYVTLDTSCQDIAASVSSLVGPPQVINS